MLWSSDNANIRGWDMLKEREIHSFGAIYCVTYELRNEGIILHCIVVKNNDGSFTYKENNINIAQNLYRKIAKLEGIKNVY